MFALRKVMKDGVEMNFALGDSYTLVTKESSPAEFERGASDHPHYDEMYGFLSWRGGSEILPLYKNQRNYIVSENGATYQNLTMKDLRIWSMPQEKRAVSNNGLSEPVPSN